MHIAPDEDQPDSFAFSKENEKQVDTLLAKYPKNRKRSAVMPLLDLVQRQHGWIPRAAMDHIAEIIEVAPIRVYEVATYYTMYHLAPVGGFHLQFCTTTPCWLCGSAGLVEAAEKKLGIKMGGTTKDGKFTMSEVECLGACVNAPVVQINDDYYEDLNPERLRDILEKMAAGKKVAPGSQTGRAGSCRTDGPTTLEDVAKSARISMATNDDKKAGSDVA